MSEEASTKSRKSKKSNSSETSSKGYALIKAAGHQFTVSEGDIIRASFTGSGDDNLETDTALTINEVLLTRSPDGKIVSGAPFVAGASVTLKLLQLEKEPKVTIFKMRRRKGYRRKTGHRQPVIAARVESISFPS